jgi:hypothetical protein
MVAATMAWTMTTGLILLEKWQEQEFTLFPMPNTTDHLLPWEYLFPKAWDYKSSISCGPSIRQIRLVVCPQQSGAVCCVDTSPTWQRATITQWLVPLSG